MKKFFCAMWEMIGLVPKIEYLIGRLETMDVTLQQVQANLAALIAAATAEHDEFVAFKQAQIDAVTAAQAARDEAITQHNADLVAISALQAQLAAGGVVTPAQLSALNDSLLATSAAIKAIVPDPVAVDAGPTVDQTTVGAAPVVTNVLETAPVTGGTDTTTVVDPTTAGTVIDTSTADQTAANPVSNSSPVDGAVTDSTVGAVPVVNANLVDPNQPA